MSELPPKKLPSEVDRSAGQKSGRNPETQIYSARFENLELVREFVAQAAQAGDLSPSEVYAVQLAVDEAFTNIIEHAYGGESDDQIECTCEELENGLAITLRDCGKPFDPTLVPDPDLEADLEERDIGGLGLFFIRHLMDKVEFAFTYQVDIDRQCNLLRMIKYKEK